MITPEQLAAPGTEHAHQCAFFQWAAVGNHNIADLEMLFSVPNGGERQKAVATNMKAEGVKSGVPDVVWPVPIGRYPGLWLELKRPGYENRALGGRAENQQRWHKMLIAKHYAVCTVYGWQAMAAAVSMYATSPQEFDYKWACRRDMADTLFVVGTSEEGFRWY